MQITSITIGGIEWRQKVFLPSFEITKDLGGRTATCELEVLENPAANAVVGIAKVGSAYVGQGLVPQLEIIAYENTTKHFGGYIAQITPEKTDDTHFRYHLACQDYSRLLTAMVESESFFGKTDQYIIQTLFTTYLSSVDTSLVENTTTLDSFEIRDETLRDVLERMVELTNKEFYIRPDKKLKYFDPAGNLASFALSENPNDSTTFGILRDSFSYTEDFANPANSITVLWSKGADNLSFSPPASLDDGSVECSDTTYPPNINLVVSDTDPAYTVRSSKIGLNYYLSKGLVRFNTASIPDSSVIRNATLKLFLNGLNNTDSGEFAIEWYAASNWPIGAGDYTTSGSSDAMDWRPLSTIPITQYVEFPLRDANLNINKTGYTGFRLHVRTASAPTGTNSINIISQDNGSDAPVLEVEYITAATTYNDTASQSAYGVHKRTITDERIATAAEALLRAQIEAARFANPLKSGTAAFHHDGADIGQKITITMPTFNVDSAFIIRQLSMKWETQTLTRYEAEVGEFRPDLVKLLRKLNK